MQEVFEKILAEKVMKEVMEIDVPDFCWNEYNRHYRNTSIETLDRINVNEADNLKKQFISIGFFLRLTKESKAYKELGYDSIEAYAHDRMGYSESRTRRLMQINAMASKDGCSPVLDEQYKAFTPSQLQEMLSMLEDQRQLVTPDMTVRQIKDMKKALKEPEPVQEEAEPKRPEPSNRDIKAFYDWMSFKATDNINAQDLKIKYRHSSGGNNKFDYKGSARGCRINYKQEITWTQLAKRLKDIQEKELAEEESRRQTQEEKEQEFPRQILDNEDLKDEACATSHREQNVGKWITGVSGSGRCGSAAYCNQPFNCCAQCSDDCNGRCGWLPTKKAEVIVETEFNEAPEAMPDNGEPEEEELLCDTCANASSLTGNPDMCANCGPDGRFYVQRGEKVCATSHKMESSPDQVIDSSSIELPEEPVAASVWSDLLSDMPVFSLVDARKYLHDVEDEYKQYLTCDGLPGWTMLRQHMKMAGARLLMRLVEELEVED